MTPAIVSKALLWVLTLWPFGNVAIRQKIQAFARALPRLAPGHSSAELGRAYIDRLGLVEGSPWRAALRDACDSLEPLPPASLRLRLVNDLSRAACDVAVPVEFGRREWVRGLLDKMLPK
jgi:hypothetical protein